MLKTLLTSIVALTALLSASQASAVVAEPGSFTSNPTFVGCDANGKSQYNVTWWSGIGAQYIRIKDNLNHTYGTYSPSTTQATIAISEDVLLQLYSDNFIGDVRPVTHQCVSPVPAPTSAPAITNVIWDHCYGSNMVSFTTVSDATSYKVLGASGASLGTTTGTNRYINVPSTQQVTVQACNEGGCGPESQPAVATYQPYCL